MLEDSGTKCFGKKYASTSGSTAGAFFVDRVREEEDGVFIDLIFAPSRLIIMDTGCILISVLAIFKLIQELKPEIFRFYFENAANNS